MPRLVDVNVLEFLGLLDTSSTVIPLKRHDDNLYCSYANLHGVFHGGGSSSHATDACRRLLMAIDESNGEWDY